MKFLSTKIIPLGSTAFRQWKASSHCNKLHGYRLQCKLWFTADELDSRNWIFDFGECKEIKKILETQFDHTTVVAADDPDLETFKLMEHKGIIDLKICEKGVGIERTAEWIYNTVSKYLNDTTDSRVRLDKVEVWEHEGNSAIYEVSETLVKETIPEIPALTPDQQENPAPPAPPARPRLNTPPLYAQVSTGMNDPFKGTSWGNNG